MTYIYNEVIFGTCLCLEYKIVPHSHTLILTNEGRIIDA